ncbi:hypothetical protein STEG23_034237 [Scotinomys teguina]
MFATLLMLSYPCSLSHQVLLRLQDRDGKVGKTGKGLPGEAAVWDLSFISYKNQKQTNKTKNPALFQYAEIIFLTVIQTSRVCGSAAANQDRWQSILEPYQDLSPLRISKDGNMDSFKGAAPPPKPQQQNDIAIGAYRGQKKTLDLLELALQAVVNCPGWVPGTEPVSSENAWSCLTGRARTVGPDPALSSGTIDINGSFGAPDVYCDRVLARDTETVKRATYFSGSRNVQSGFLRCLHCDDDLLMEGLDAVDVLIGHVRQCETWSRI